MPRSAAAEGAGIEDRILSGWGRTAPSGARVLSPDSLSELPPSERGIIARGLGRSYGDAAQCAGGLVVETSRLDVIGEIDPGTGEVEVGAGVSLEGLLEAALPKGWFIPVSPGTRQVTVGGAIAADVHGKNHHADGSFCSHVRSITLVTPNGVLEVGPDAEPAVFWATAGGMGLTGVVTRARVRMRPVETSWMRVDTERHGDLDSLMGALERVDRDHRYSVAWVDCAAKGSRFGRGLLDAGDHAEVAALSARRARDPLAPPRPSPVRLPPVVPSGVVNPFTIAAFNEAWFRKSRPRQGHLRHLAGFFHPLDAVANWNHLYGRRGFVQYQYVVADEHRDLIGTSIEHLQRAGAPVSLSVLKRFGPADPGPLSFPTPGWTLALDLPVGPPGVPAALQDLDEMVAAAGGRVYLAKDARMDRYVFARMYPRLDEFEAIRAKLDPDGVLQSDLARRLGLCEESR